MGPTGLLADLVDRYVALIRKQEKRREERVRRLVDSRRLWLKPRHRRTRNELLAEIRRLEDELHQAHSQAAVAGRERDKYERREQIHTSFGEMPLYLTKDEADTLQQNLLAVTHEFGGPDTDADRSLYAKVQDFVSEV